jgi:hypothetical protein
MATIKEMENGELLVLQKAIESEIKERRKKIKKKEFTLEKAKSYILKGSIEKDILLVDWTHKNEEIIVISKWYKESIEYWIDIYHIDALDPDWQNLDFDLVREFSLDLDNLKNIKNAFEQEINNRETQ